MSTHVLLEPPVSACDGSTAELTGNAGEFGVVGSQYKNELYCRWRITVETGKVSFDYIV